LTVTIAYIVLFISAYVFVAFKGKSIIIKQLEGLTHKKVSAGQFKLMLPFTLDIKDLNVEGLAKVDEISITPSIPYFLMGNIAFNDISVINPKITYNRVPPPQAVVSSTAEAPVKAAAVPEIKAKVEPKKKRPLRLVLKHVTVKDGNIDFIDYTVKADGIKITIKDINFKLTKLYTFPFPAITNFELKGRIPWQEGEEEGKISVEGWLNYYKKDIQAAIKIEDIDGIYLSPYYSSWVDLEKARIEKASLSFTSNIQGLNNSVTAECHLELTDIVRKPRPAEVSEGKEEKVTSVVLDTFKALDQGKVVLDFAIKTRMDRPELGISNIQTAFADKIAKVRDSNSLKTEDVLVLPLKILESTVKGATDISRAVIDGTFAIGKALKDAAEDSFRK